MSTTTVTSISQAQEILALYDDAKFNEVSTHVLRTLLRHLGVKAIERNGELVPIRSTRKDECVENLKQALAKQRALNAAVIPTEELESAIKIPTAEEILKQLEELATLPVNRVQTEVSKLAHQTIVAIAKAYPDTSELLKFHTRCNKRSKLLSALNYLVNQSEVVGLEVVYGRFRELVMHFTESDTVSKRRTGEQGKDAYDASVKPVNLTTLVDFAESTLTKVSAGELSSTDWKDVAISIALLTGRRMYSEVLYEVCQFSVNDGSLRVTGLAKDKTDEVREIEDLTCLCEPELIVAGVQWLQTTGYNPRTKETGKRYKKTGDDQYTQTKDKANSNGRYSKDLGKHWKTRATELGLPECTIHDLRKFYTLLALENFEGTVRSRGKEAARLLGQRDWATANDSYICEWTLESAA